MAKNNISKKSFARTLLGASYEPPKAAVARERLFKFACENVPSQYKMVGEKYLYRTKFLNRILYLKAKSTEGELVALVYVVNLERGSCRLQVGSTCVDLSKQWNKFLAEEALRAVTVDRESSM
ncbi:MAG: hypothetical protein J6A28_00180 [Clostridia bacterium]|nr:hypothetical protein [Clostridia bacterium]